MPVCTVDDIRAECLEAKMRGEHPPSRCPLCWSICEVREQTHHYGYQIVVEFRDIECPNCANVGDCRTCFKYILQYPEEVQDPSVVDTAMLCTCPDDPPKEGAF